MKIIRKCQSCRNSQDRDLMIKITKTKDGLIINPNSKQIGRSMYVCKNTECIKNLIKKHKIKSALKYSNMDEIEKIEQKLKDFIEEQNTHINV